MRIAGGHRPSAVTLFSALLGVICLSMVCSASPALSVEPRLNFLALRGYAVGKLSLLHLLRLPAEHFPSKISPASHVAQRLCAHVRLTPSRSCQARVFGHHTLSPDHVISACYAHSGATIGSIAIMTVSVSPDSTTAISVTHR